MSILVIDVGTSGVRSSVVRPDATIVAERYQELLPSTPQPGFVELDASALAAAVLEIADATLNEFGSVDAVGIANQRATTVVWDRKTGEPVGPGIGWQDLRTVINCLMLQAQGFRLSPSATATKAQFLFDQFDPQRSRDLCVGTIDSWIAWTLSKGEAHVTDLSNAGVTGLLKSDASGWSLPLLEALSIPESCMPTLVDSTGVIANATALKGAPPITSLIGDQQASLIGQGCVRPGLAKATFGTGGMLDLCLDSTRPAFEARGDAGCIPIVAWRSRDKVVWGLEAVMLSAGSAVEWLRDDMGVIQTVAQSHEVAAACETSDGVWFVPALLGLGTPAWDYGARGTLLGLTRGSGKAQVVRAVLEGVAHRGADLLEAAELDANTQISTLRIDGGMSANPTFVQALANTTQRPIEVSPVLEATTLGAAFLGGLAIGTWSDWDDIAASWKPVLVVEPTHQLDRQRWTQAIERSSTWLPDLSALDF